jgi:hypothetical protein
MRTNVQAADAQQAKRLDCGAAKLLSSRRDLHCTAGEVHSKRLRLCTKRSWPVYGLDNGLAALLEDTQRRVAASRFSHLHDPVGAASFRELPRCLVDRPAHAKHSRPTSRCSATDVGARVAYVPRLRRPSSGCVRKPHGQMSWQRERLGPGVVAHSSLKRQLHSCSPRSPQRLPPAQMLGARPTLAQGSFTRAAGVEASAGVREEGCDRDRTRRKRAIASSPLTSRLQPPPQQPIA